MTARSRLRALALVPVLHAFYGIWVLAAAASLRPYMSPAPGYVAGGTLALVAAVSAQQLWRMKTRAPVWLAASGVATLGLLLLSGRLFPIVEARSDAPSIIDRIRYPAILGLATLSALLAPAFAHASLRRSA